MKKQSMKRVLLVTSFWLLEQGRSYDESLFLLDCDNNLSRFFHHYTIKCKHRTCNNFIEKKRLDNGLSATDVKMGGLCLARLGIADGDARP